MRECDTGIVQIDSLSLDEAETVRRASAFHQHLDALADEAGWLRSVGARLVVGDIPPLAFAAAHAAGLPAIAMGNFTWDWIYEGYREWLPQGPISWKLGDAYALADTALRLPMHGGFATMREVVDLPFIARRSTRAPPTRGHNSVFRAITRWCCCPLAGTGCSASILAPQPA